MERIDRGCKASLTELARSCGDVGELGVGQGVEAEPGAFTQEKAEEKALRLISQSLACSTLES